MARNIITRLGICLCSLLLAGALAACGSPASVSGKYSTDNMGLTFSAFEFTGGDQVTLYCAGFANAQGTYKAEGNHYLITIDDHDEDSYYYGMVKEIKDDCNIIVTPVDENTISVEIKSKNSGEVVLGWLGAKEYTKE